MEWVFHVFGAQTRYLDLAIKKFDTCEFVSNNCSILRPIHCVRPACSFSISMSFFIQPIYYVMLFPVDKSQAEALSIGLLVISEHF